MRGSERGRQRAAFARARGAAGERESERERDPKSSLASGWLGRRRADGLGIGTVLSQTFVEKEPGE